MPRHPYPPRNFECPYRRHCPHLDLLSTTWVYGEFRRSRVVYQEQLRIMDRYREELDAKGKRIRILERENAELKAKKQALHQKQFKSNRKPKVSARKAAGPQVAEAKQEKKRGAPVGHPYWSRPKPDRIDRTVFVAAPTCCPYCRSEELRPTTETTEHIQEDISPPPPPVVTRYVHNTAYCVRCGKVVSQAGEDEMPGAYIGPLAKAAAIYLRHDIGVPYRKTQRLFRDLFGLSFAPASAVGFDRRATILGLPLYEDLREKIRASAVVHADETSWRNDGLGHFAWYAGNDDIAFFHIDRHRSKNVAKSIFGDDFSGVLVRDRYAAYNGIGSDWQACLAHISRNAKDIAAEHALLPRSEQDANVDAFTAGVRDLCSQACNAGFLFRSGALPWEAAATVEMRLTRRLESICEQPLAFRSAETLRSYLVGPEQKRLFTFLRYPGVLPTNNHAEQTLRRMVIFRKICFGTRSESGLMTHSVLPSLVLTAKRQGVDPRKFLKILLTSDTVVAQAALYDNTS